jgi:hypothetical protein
MADLNITKMQLARRITRSSGAGYDRACSPKPEGIVSKEVDTHALQSRPVARSTPEPRGRAGWTDPEAPRPWLGALLLAYYDPDGWLV